jgi:L-rhamnose isomerase/sugar isomerase
MPLSQAKVKSLVRAWKIEAPSWAFGNGGTRFKVFHQKGAARNIREKLQDAAVVHKLTGATPTVAVHMLWDLAEMPPDEVRDCAREAGLGIGAMNPTLFEQPEYLYGSLASPQRKAREKAIAHLLDCIEAMARLESRALSVWLADGTNHPGQDDFRARRRRLAEALKIAHDALGPGMQLLLEYKLYEPAFYSTDIADWGMAYILCKEAGAKARVLVDLGHHAQGVNIEQIVATLIDEEMLGGFHFNSRKYGDDDLTTGTMNPHELFLIFNELVAAAGGRGITPGAYVIDQSHNIEPKIEAMLLSVMNMQAMYARALLVDRAALREAQRRCDVLGAERVLQKAYETDVTPLLAEMRKEAGLPPDPFEAYRRSGHQEKIERERG